MVNMGDLEVSQRPGDVLTSLGLGSCVAVCAYDPAVRVAGMIHVVLPNSAISRGKEGPAKFADLGVPRLVEELAGAGATRRRLRVAVLGGANVLSCGNLAKTLDIGARNVSAVEEALRAQGLSLWANEVGGKVSRTVRLWVADGRVTVKTLRQGEVEVTVLGGENARGSRKCRFACAPDGARPDTSTGGG